MSLITQWIDSNMDATGMDAVDALRAFFLLAAATVRYAL
jgi:3-oxo-5-alpha-steroid 4-dehydrogenase 3